jgi:microcin C transport system substrate-binding protein
MNFKVSVLLLCATALIGCGAPNEAPSEPTRDARADAAEYYKAHPDFFCFATSADLPSGLVWQTGENVTPLGDPHAIRGGTFHDFIADFPRTLRVVGPDANGSTRSIIFDDIALGLLGFDPNSLEPFPSLASSWAVSEDKKTYYFRLDPDARFFRRRTQSLPTIIFLHSTFS